MDLENWMPSPSYVRFVLALLVLIIAIESRGHANEAFAAPSTQLRGFGMVAKLGHSPEFNDQQIKLMRMLGVSVVLWCPGEWAENEKIKDQYALLPEVQRDIHLLTAAHIKVMVGLFRKNTLYANPLDPDAFANYCAWIVTALKHEPIIAYQIWNEPSNFDFGSQYGGSWNGVGNSPWLPKFVEVMGHAARAIKQADPRATVLVNLEGPPLVLALRSSPHEFADIDGVSIHPYAGKFPPEQVPWGGPENYLRDGVALADADHSLVSNLRFQADDYPEKYLGRRLQTWITEYGFPTCDLAVHPEHFDCVSPQAQAAFHARGMILGFSHGARVWGIYELTDEGSDRSDPEQNFGIIESATNGYVPKPAFLTLQRLARILGANWIYLPNIPASLATPDSPQIRPGASATTVSGPQMEWFATARGYAGFIWRAGPYDEIRTPARIRLSVALPATARIVATDVVTGETLHPAHINDHGVITISDLPIGSSPRVIEVLRR
jgi:hypothetical protein